ENQRVRRGAGGNAGRARIAERQRAGTGFRQQRVGVTVVTAFELDDQAAPGEAAREPHRGHGRLGARRRQAHHLHGGNQPAQELRQLDFGLRRRTEGERPGGRLLHRLDHRRVGVSRNHGSPRPEVVDIAAPFRVPEIGARGALEERRRAADRAEGAHRRIHARRDAPLRALEKILVFHAKSPWYWPARARMSGASKRSDTTASRSAPAAITCGAFARVMPPIAQSGTPNLVAKRAKGARTAAGLVVDANTLPKAT